MEISFIVTMKLAYGPAVDESWTTEGAKKKKKKKKETDFVLKTSC